MYKKTFSTLGCADLELNEAVALAAAFNIEVIELRALGDTVDLPAYFAAKFGTPERLKAWRENQSISIRVIGTSFPLIGASAVERTRLLDYIPWTEALGSRYLRAFDGGSREGSRQFSEAAETFGWWRNLRADAGWKTDLIVETHDSLLDAERIAAFVTKVPDAAILWDTHHTWKRGGEDPVATWNRIHAYVRHIHVKDSIAVPNGDNPYTYVEPGRGDFPMTRLKPLLAEGFDGAVSLEWERYWIKSLGRLDGALASAEQRHWW